METPIYSSSVRLVDADRLAKEIAKALVFREYKQVLNDTFYKTDDDGEILIDDDGNRVFTDRFNRLMHHNYLFYKEIIIHHKKPDPIRIDVDTSSDETDLEEIEEPNTNIVSAFLNRLRDFFNVF